MTSTERCKPEDLTFDDPDDNLTPRYRWVDWIMRPDAHIIGAALIAIDMSFRVEWCSQAINQIIAFCQGG